MPDDNNVVNLEARRLIKQVEDDLQLEVVFIVKMAGNTCTVETRMDPNSAVDITDRETIRRVCAAMNTAMHATMRQHGIRTLKAQRQRLRLRLR